MRYIVRVDEQTLYKKDINTEIGLRNQMTTEGLKAIKYAYSSFGGCYFIEVEAENDIKTKDSVVTKLDTLPKDFKWESFGTIVELQK
tara:strand:+ start:98 stop:358 length:261 start_codon:yes stop_codon:yes gene_type:complete